MLLNLFHLLRDYICVCVQAGALPDVARVRQQRGGQLPVLVRAGGVRGRAAPRRRAPRLPRRHARVLAPAGRR